MEGGEGGGCEWRVVKPHLVERREAERDTSSSSTMRRAVECLQAPRQQAGRQQAPRQQGPRPQGRAKRVELKQQEGRQWRLGSRKSSDGCGQDWGVEIWGCGQGPAKRQQLARAHHNKESSNPLSAMTSPMSDHRIAAPPCPGCSLVQSG